MPKPRYEEKDLASHVVAWLSGQSWEVYQEVKLGHSGPRADLVGRRQDDLLVVETKMGICLTLLDQAYRWTRYAHYVSVAIPYSRRDLSPIARLVLKTSGIGALQIDLAHGKVRQLVPSRRQNTSGNHLNLIRYLYEAQKTWAPAGNADNAFWSPYQETCRRLVDFVQAHPGCTLQEAVRGCPGHHYASDRSAMASLLKWITAGKVKGVHGIVEGRKLRLYPDHFQKC